MISSPVHQLSAEQHRYYSKWFYLTYSLLNCEAMETKNIERAERLPDIYFCVNGDSMDKNLQKHGYIDSFYILRGQVIEIEE